MDEQNYRDNYYNPYQGTTGTNYYQTNVTAPEPEKKKKKKEKKQGGHFFPKFIGAIVLGVSFGACAAGGFYLTQNLIVKNGAVTEAATETEVNELQASIDELAETVALNAEANVTTVTTTGSSTMVVTDVTEVVNKVMPSMVSVTNTYTETSSYFGRSYSSTAQSCGSGIIVGESDTEYFIATNYHVIEDCVSLSVQFVDDTEATAYVKGYVEDIDIAVISVEKADLEASTMAVIAVAELGDSDSLTMGEPAIAIGNALGYGQSVTTGVISALNREIDLENSSSNLIQTSAAINPGNSGGALLNISGQVIGINSSKLAATQVEGIGFAIPINEVKEIIEDLSSRTTKIKVDEDERGYLGITGLSDSYYSQFVSSMGYPEGACVYEVKAGSAAEAAGIVKGDVITECDGQSIDSLTELQNALSYYKAGDTLTLKVQRLESGEFVEHTVEVTLSGKSVFNEE